MLASSWKSSETKGKSLENLAEGLSARDAVVAAAD